MQYVTEVKSERIKVYLGSRQDNLIGKNASIEGVIKFIDQQDRRLSRNWKFHICL